MANTRSRATWRVTLLVIGLLTWLSLRPVTGHAHSGTAAFETLKAEGGSDLVLDVRLRVRYSEDQEPADRAFVKVTLRSPDGRTLPTVDLDRENGGIYSGTITVDRPGMWTVEVSSAFPPGSTTLRVDVGDRDGNRTWLVVVGVAGVAVLVGLLVLTARRRGASTK